MASLFQPISGSITVPKGFRTSGVYCDVKRLGTGKGSNKKVDLDLAVIASEVAGPVAGLVTTNQVCAAPVKWCLERLKTGRGQAIVVNSGNANACTGERGLRDAQTMARQTGRALKIDPHLVYVASTGRIGIALPMPNVNRGIREAVSCLRSGSRIDRLAAQAIMTSDTHPKEYAVEIPVREGRIRIGGIAKGAGMIDPWMTPTGKRSSESGLHATMLAFLTTDAAMDQALLQRALNRAVLHSFNAVTVDGDMSTNDTVLLMANGLAGNRVIRSDRSPAFRAFQAALDRVCLELAHMMVKDAEGASKFVTLKVSGARSDAEARSAATAVANSLLVKTSWCGGDPNWGRILDALGYSSAQIVEEKVDLAYSAPDSEKKAYSLRGGKPTRVSFDRLCAEVARDAFELHIDLNLGKGKAEVYTCDLTEEYVDFNKGDISNPAALGG